MTNLDIEINLLEQQLEIIRSIADEMLHNRKISLRECDELEFTLDDGQDNFNHLRGL